MQAAPAGPRLAARSDRHARSRSPTSCTRYEAGRRRPSDLRAAGRHEPPRARLRVTRAVRGGGDAALPRGARTAREAAKAQRLEPMIQAALARREPGRDQRHAIHDRTSRPSLPARAGRDAPPHSARARWRNWRSNRSATVRASAPRRCSRGCRRASEAPSSGVSAGGDRSERCSPGWRVAFEPDAAAGFQGRIVVRARAAGDRRRTDAMDDRDRQRHATARPGHGADAALTLHFRLADFVRIAAGKIDPAVPLLEGRASFEGDFALAARLPEMFGAPIAVLVSHASRPALRSRARPHARSAIGARCGSSSGQTPARP